MPARPALLAAALLLVAIPSIAHVDAQAIEYATGTTRYLVTTNTKGTQSSPMGTQSFEVGVRERLTVAVGRPAKDTLVATMTLDSLTVTSASPFPDVSKYQGSQFVSRLSPTGRVYSTTGPNGQDVLLGQLAEAITRFLPVYRPNLRVGLAWADTTSDKVTQQGIEVDRTTIAAYEVQGDTVVGGTPAFRIKRRATMKAAGSGTTNGSSVGLTTLSTSDALLLLSHQGVYLGGDANDGIELTITIAGTTPTVISVKQTSVQTVRPAR